MKINKTNEFIEIIGHYDNDVQCAKMTLLADLYAIEHKSGYAKFPLNIADKLKLVDGKLEFAPSGTLNIYSANGQTLLYTNSTFNSVKYKETSSSKGIYGYEADTSLLFDLSSYDGISESIGGTPVANERVFSFSGDILNLYVLEAAAPQITCDLTTLSGWEALSTGNHTITVKAKATGYQDSEASSGVVVNKAAATETWVINSSPDTEQDFSSTISFTSNNQQFTGFTVNRRYSEIHYQPSELIVYNGEWSNQAYRTVTFATSPTGNLLTWLQSNAVKQ